MYLKVKSAALTALAKDKVRRIKGVIVPLIIDITVFV